MDWQFFWAMVRLVIFLPLVLGLAYLACRYLMPWRFRWQSWGSLQIVERLALGQRAGLYIIRLGNKYFLFSATEREVKLVKELDDYSAAVLETNRSSSSFFKRSLGFTGRKVGGNGERHEP